MLRSDPQAELMFRCIAAKQLATKCACFEPKEKSQGERCPGGNEVPLCVECVSTRYDRCHPHGPAEFVAYGPLRPCVGCGCRTTAYVIAGSTILQVPDPSCPACGTDGHTDADHEPAQRACFEPKEKSDDPR
jgi:hypothetical protein